MTASRCDHDAAQGYPCGNGVTRWRCPDCGVVWTDPPSQESRRGAG